MDPATLRVAFLVDAIRGRNGVGTYYADLVDHLQPRVAHAALFAPRLGEPDPTQGMSVPMPGDYTQRMYLPKFRRLAREVAEVQPHVMVLPTPGPYGAVGYWMARGSGAARCVPYQTDYERLMEIYWHPLLAGLPRLVMRNLQRFFFRGSTTVLAVSEDMAARARSTGHGDVRLIGTPIGREFLDTPAPPLREHLSTVLFVGRLAPEKNIDAFLNAAREHPEMQFHIAGDGPMRVPIRKQAKQTPNLTYHGWCSREQVVGLLDRVDMLVLPSHEEAFGTVVLEAMARGRLVLTSPACGVNRWPTLARGLNVQLPGESVAASIHRLAALPASERRATAAAARDGATQLNGDTIGHWVGILTELAEDAKLRFTPKPAVAAAES